jgi:hypothetical protein
VSIKHRLQRLLLCFALLLGAISGIAMRPEEIEELMHTMNQPKVVVTIPDENENGDGSLPKLPEADP